MMWIIKGMGNERTYLFAKNRRKIVKQSLDIVDLTIQF